MSQDEKSVDHTRGAKGPVVPLTSPTPPQSPKPDTTVGEGGSYDPESDDIVGRVIGKIKEIEEASIAGSKEYKAVKHTQGPAPGDKVIA